MVYFDFAVNDPGPDHVITTPEPTELDRQIERWFAEDVAEMELDKTNNIGKVLSDHFLEKQSSQLVRKEKAGKLIMSWSV